MEQDFSLVDKNASFNKQSIPLFDLVDWEIKFNSLSELANSSNNIVNQVQSCPEFLNSMQTKLSENFETQLLKQELSASQTEIKRNEFNSTLGDKVKKKLIEMESIFNDGLAKLIQKQNANAFITTVIDRDENCKLACMNSLYGIYNSFLHPALLLTIVSLLNLNTFSSNESSLNDIEAQMEAITKNLDNPATIAAEILKIPSVAIIASEKKIGFQTQEE